MFVFASKILQIENYLLWCKIWYTIGKWQFHLQHFQLDPILLNTELLRLFQKKFKLDIVTLEYISIINLVPILLH